AARGAAAVAARRHARARAATPRAARGTRQARPGRHAAGAAASCRSATAAQSRAGAEPRAVPARRDGGRARLARGRRGRPEAASGRVERNGRAAPGQRGGGAGREETRGALDRALSETAALADREQQVAEALRRGEGGPATRSRQASIEEGTTAVERQIREAAGKHALVSPQLEGALGFAERQMAAAREQLRAIAARQRALAQQLERLQAEGGSAAAGALAQEARELARQLDAGRLDHQTIQRQERLYRRLLDAGRTLSGSEPDESKERTSRPA